MGHIRRFMLQIRLGIFDAIDWVTKLKGLRKLYYAMLRICKADTICGENVSMSYNKGQEFQDL